MAGCSESINRGAKGPSDVCSQGRINRTWLVCFCVCVCYFDYYLFLLFNVVVHVFYLNVLFLLLFLLAEVK